jgi:hypothetical protein
VHDACHIIHIAARHELNASIGHWQQLINLLLGSWMALYSVSHHKPVCVVAIVTHLPIHVWYYCSAS